MNILFIGSEALPYASTGGLGDVLGSLPAAVKRTLGEGSDVRVVIPLYSIIRARFGDELSLVSEINVKLSWRNQYCGIYETERDGVKYYFLDNEYYFKRTAMYGNFDDGERFAFFGKATLEMLPHIGFWPDIIHANDWQTATSVIYLKRKYAHLTEYASIKALYTIHNIGYQGVYDFNILNDIFELNFWDRSILDYDGMLNLTKGAIVCADRVSTVSPRYAEEIKTEYYSSGLHHILRLYADKLSGIINGIDVDYYNPETDPCIEARYSADDPSGKKVDKAAMQKLAGLTVRDDVPVVAMVSRLASHKGFDLVKYVFGELLAGGDMQFVLLGKGEFEFEYFFDEMAKRMPDRVAAMLVYDKDLSKKVYAGADIFLMPSKSEPCGLAQMIASRYGTVPVVRETGGLYDTIKPYNKYTGTGNGFTFTNYNAHDMMNVLREAAALWREPDKWEPLMKRAMKTDFSWDASAEKYAQLYESMIK